MHCTEQLTTVAKMRCNSLMTDKQAGFTLVELCVVLAGAVIIAGIAIPALETVLDQHRLVLAAQTIVTQMQFARMKAVTSNEPFRVNFPAGQRSFQVETSTGALVAGPFALPLGIEFSALSGGPPITFTGRFVLFSPTGNVPAGGNGSAGRVMMINRSGARVDVVVGSGGIIRQTPVYRSTSPTF
jgi:type II secretory pathway pseudopilin PulG